MGYGRRRSAVKSALGVNCMKADDLKKIFAVFGHFITLSLGGKSVDLRPVLELLRKDLLPDHPDKIGRMIPDLLVIMMNPGSSRPLDPRYCPARVDKPQEIQPFGELTPTRPDTTQYQIMRVMWAKGLGHARVLNLSDLRETKSTVFIPRYQELERIPGGLAHSLFSPSRSAERRLRMGQDAPRPVLVGWGRHPGLLPLARQCLDTLDMKRVIGVEVPGYPELYTHPSPMMQKSKEAWVNAILEKWGEFFDS